MLDEQTRRHLKGPPQGAEAEGQPCNAKTRNLFGRCDRRATVERDGRWFCWQHDPERFQAERAARAARRRQEAMAHEAEIEARWRRDDLLRNSGVGALTNQDLEQIVAAGGIRAFLPWHLGETDTDVND
jgi:hypothetical protein